MLYPIRHGETPGITVLHPGFEWNRIPAELVGCAESVLSRANPPFD